MIHYILPLIILLITTSCGADFNTKAGSRGNIDATIVTKVNQAQYTIQDKTPDTIIKKVSGQYTLASPHGDTQEIAWANKFKIVELGNLEDSDTSYKLLQDTGLIKRPYHIAYDWMPALYYYTTASNRPFVQWLYDNKETATLNPNGPFVHCKDNNYDWCQDYYFNLANPTVLQKRVEDITNNLQTKGFNGLFFDWAPGGYINSEEYKNILNTFKSLNPDITYTQSVTQFYKELQKKDIFVVTNQAFRNHKNILPYVNYDMTESYITRTKELTKKVQLVDKGWIESIPLTNYYPIQSNSTDINDSLEYINLLSTYKEKYKKDGFVNFIYLNYLAPEYERVYSASQLYKQKKPKNGIYFSYAMAKLSDSIVYAEVPSNRALERDDIYFYDLGYPLTDTYEKLNALNAYVRFYEKGFVLASDAYTQDLYLKIQSPLIKKNNYIFNAYEQNWLQSNDAHEIIIKLHFEQGMFQTKKSPLGRVYLYL